MAGRALHTNLSQVTRRVRLFGNIVGWVLGEVYRNAKGQFVLIFALSVLGVFARLGAIGSFMTYVHAQQKDQPVIVRGVELPSDTGLWTLLTRSTGGGWRARTCPKRCMSWVCWLGWSGRIDESAGAGLRSQRLPRRRVRPECSAGRGGDVAGALVGSLHGA